MSSIKWLMAMAAFALLVPGLASAAPAVPVQPTHRTQVIAVQDEAPTTSSEKPVKKKGKKKKKPETKEKESTD